MILLETHRKRESLTVWPMANAWRTGGEEIQGNSAIFPRRNPIDETILLATACRSGAADPFRSTHGEIVEEMIVNRPFSPIFIHIFYLFDLFISN